MSIDHQHVEQLIRSEKFVYPRFIVFKQQTMSFDFRSQVWVKWLFSTAQLRLYSALLDSTQVLFHFHSWVLHSSSSVCYGDIVSLSFLDRGGQSVVAVSCRFYVGSSPLKSQLRHYQKSTRCYPQWKSNKKKKNSSRVKQSSTSWKRL